jgi:hypothetical protein
VIKALEAAFATFETQAFETILGQHDPVAPMLSVFIPLPRHDTHGAVGVAPWFVTIARITLNSTAVRARTARERKRALL